jgi:hypothetical protein
VNPHGRTRVWMRGQSGRAADLRSAPGVRAVAAAALLVGYALVVAGCAGGAGHHPSPRTNVTGERVLAASTWGADVRLARAYVDARDYLM